jgi:hypothetical protein
MSSRRDPLDRLVEFGMAIPACTALAARRAVPLVARVGTLGVARVIGRASTAVHERRTERPEPAESETTAPRQSVTQSLEPADDTAVDDLPIEGYDDLAARQVVDRLGTLDRDDLSRIERYERRHRNRSTVMGKIAQLTG